MPSSQPVILVLFGITGDLASRKLLPALYNLIDEGLWHEQNIILGISRREVTTEQIIQNLEQTFQNSAQSLNPASLDRFRAALHMHTMSLTEGADYEGLGQLINSLETERGTCLNRLYYLSVPPQSVLPIVENLGSHGLNQSCQHGTAASRLLVEKPFGSDATSAQALLQATSQWFSEEQIFRIDHYVAKETVQNILAFRMHNALFNGIWNRQYIDHITITAFEKLSIEGRAVFYEEVGALRDFIQSHLLQVLSIVTMEPPLSDDSNSIHRAKEQLLASITPLDGDSVDSKTVRGQYEGYRQEVENPASLTETYAEITLEIANDRWRGVPMILRTGKAMAERLTEVKVHFRNLDALDAAPNELVFNIQPGEGISLLLDAKQPGFNNQLQTVTMDFNYQKSFQAIRIPDAYERVFHDAIRGDHALFMTGDEVLHAWRAVDGVLQRWQQSDSGLISYPKGSPSVGPT